MKAIGFGAILWDDLGGETGDGSAAAEGSIGGAVFNVIVHLRKLGYEAFMLSAIGADGLGEKTFQEVRRLSVRRDFIGTVSEPTCLIHVSFDEEGFPHYSSPDIVSWDRIDVDDGLLARLDGEGMDCLVFGTLEQRSTVSRNALRRVIEETRIKMRFVDLTLRGGFYDKDLLEYSLRKAHIAKMNEEEAQVVNRLFGFGVTDSRKLVPLFCREFGNEIACITLGAMGAVIGDRSSVVYKPGYKVAVRDTVGSGDAFSAGLLYMLGRGFGLDEACDFANKMGALISTKQSSIPDYGLGELEGIVDLAPAASWNAGS